MTTLVQRLKGGMPLTQAADFFPHRPHIATMHRWCIKGCRGAKLRSWMVGGVRHTDEQAIEEFLLALNRDSTDDTDDTARRAREAGTALEKLGC